MSSFVSDDTDCTCEYSETDDLPKVAVIKTDKVPEKPGAEKPGEKGEDPDFIKYDVTSYKLDVNVEKEMADIAAEVGHCTGDCATCVV